MVVKVSIDVGLATWAQFLHQTQSRCHLKDAIISEFRFIIFTILPKLMKFPFTPEFGTKINITTLCDQTKVSD